MHNENLRDLTNYEHFYLQRQLNHAVELETVVTHNTVETAAALQNQLIVAYILAIPMLYLFVVRPIVYRLDNELKRTRALLLLIPEDVLENLPVLRTFLIAQLKLMD